MKRLAALAVILAATVANADGGGDAMRHEELKLANGMRVLLLPDHGSPTLAVVTWYRVGSGDEVAGKSGFAHLFEHLMFEGSPHIAKGQMDLLFEQQGGWTNAYTSTDETVYTEVAGAPILERALWLEADRIAGLPDAIDQAKLDNQRDVVLNERRETHENRPYGMAEILVDGALWPAGHPYHISTIGLPEDLKAAQLADVKAFFVANYTPANAVMVIAGDFDPAVAKKLLATYLGGIPSKSAPPRPTVPPFAPLDHEVQLKAVDDVNAARVYLAWRAPAQYTADEPALVLTASILAGGKSSRLYQRLVVETRLAQDVEMAVDGHSLAGDVQIVATAKPGVDPQKLIAAIDLELAGLAAAPPDADELDRARNTHEREALAQLAGVDSRAERLAEYTVLAGDPDYLDKDLARYRAVTPSDVRRAVGRYLQPGQRVTLTISPGPAHAP